jgi:aminoglycoside phosphotransferase (APT) family kinase protein
MRAQRGEYVRCRCFVASGRAARVGAPPFTDALAQGGERGAQFLGEELRLFPGGEVAAFDATPRSGVFDSPPPRSPHGLYAEAAWPAPPHISASALATAAHNARMRTRRFASALHTSKSTAPCGHDPAMNVRADERAPHDWGKEHVAAHKLHDGEVDIDAALVRRLLITQFPRFRDLPVDEAQSTGTMNAIYRLGDDLCVRLPRVARWAGALEKELRWLPMLAPCLTLRVPEPIARGEPESEFPFVWAVYRWLDGETVATGHLVDERQAATDLAQFVGELRQVDAACAPRSGRRPLPHLDSVTRHAIDACGDVIDTDAAVSAWERCLQAPIWDGRPVWRHCDLLTPNLLLERGRLRAVIDFGAVGVGDPAADVIPAWCVFGTLGRQTFRNALDVDNATWDRARGFALHQALLIIPYYRDTNPAFVSTAIRTVEEVLTDTDI